MYEQQLTWARVVAWAGLVLTLLFLANLVLLVLDGGALRVLPVVYALLWVNLAIAGATRARHMKTILGSDPEEPVEQVMARSEEVTRRVVYPAVVAFDAVCAVLVVVLVPQAWPVATAAGLVALALAVAWWRARRHRDHDSAVVDPPSARR
ncbi:hypothetical protein AWH69_00950 [Janibacter melonis]|uniref:Uncharacterized protein n=1 Tax=Janibacter melonis TaxID=262209 RepID=A0A176QFE5_9MICO|nr:hypothetical protein AWH69_00950 [Janibacter melonis]